MNTHCNLLPRSLRRSRVLCGRIRRWSLVAGLVLIGLVTLSCWHVHAHTRAAAQLDDARQRTADLREHLERSAERRVRLADVRGQLAVRERLVPTEDTLHVLDLVGRGHGRTFGRLSVGRLHVVRERVETPPARPGGPPTAFERTRFEVTGLALDDESLSRFVSTLRREAGGGRVELQSGSKVEVAGREARRYVVECVFE